MIRWHCTCRASKHCPSSVYTDLLPAYPVLKIEHNHCPEPMKLEVIFLKKYALIEYFLVLPKCHATKISVTKMSYYRNVLLPKCPVTEMSCDRNVLLPKCQLPKRPLPMCPLPKCLDTEWDTIMHIQYYLFTCYMYVHACMLTTYTTQCTHAHTNTHTNRFN